MTVGCLDDVVRGARVASEPQGRDGACVDDEQILELPRIWNVLVPRKDEIYTCPLQAFDRVAGVVDDVALAARSGHRKQVVVQDEDTQPGRGRELVFDPAVTAAADLTVIEVGL